MRLCTTIYNAIVLRKGAKYDKINCAFNGKKGVWVGTSIPAGVDERKYPDVVCGRLGMTGYNESLGSSGCRIGSLNANIWSDTKKPTWTNGGLVSPVNGNIVANANYRYCEYGFDELAKIRLNGTVTSAETVGIVVYLDENKAFLYCPVSINAGGTLNLTNEVLQNAPTGTRYIRLCTPLTNELSYNIYDAYGWINWSYYSIGVALSSTTAEKRHFVNCYTLYQPFLAAGAPATLSTDLANQFLTLSYETKLISRYFATVSKKPDVLFFNHGFNENVNSETFEEFTTIPANSRDRGTFIGSANYIIDQCLKYNPDLRIVFIGHYQGDDEKSKKIDAALQTLADYWCAPYIKLWDKLNWSNQPVQVKGHWIGSDAVGWSWEATSETYTMSRKNYYIPDQTHPDRDTSLKAINLIVNNLVTEIARLA
jgi:hypothetical protein